MQNKIIKFHTSSISNPNGSDDLTVEHCKMVSYLSETLPNLKYLNYVRKCGLLGINSVGREVFEQNVEIGF